MKIVILSVITLSLVGCGTVTPVQQAGNDCLQMGFAPGSSSYSNCMLTRVNSIENNRPRLRVGSPSDEFMRSLNTPIQPGVIHHSPQPITCVHRIGNRIECN